MRLSVMSGYVQNTAQNNTVSRLNTIWSLLASFIRFSFAVDVSDTRVTQRTKVLDKFWAEWFWAQTFIHNDVIRNKRNNVFFVVSKRIFFKYVTRISLFSLRDQFFFARHVYSEFSIPVSVRFDTISQTFLLNKLIRYITKRLSHHV